MSSGRLTDSHIAELAELYGWRHHHGAPSFTADGYRDGFPPHVLLRAGRLVFIAIARPGLSAPEREWADELDAATTLEVHIAERGELRALTRLLRPDEPRAKARTLDPRAPPRPKKDARPRQRSGRQKQSSQAPTSQEEACEGQTAS